MKNSTLQKSCANTFKLFLITVSLWLCGMNTSAQVMYGDTIFWENFGTGTARADISGLAQIGGLYMYTGDARFAIGLNSADLSAYITANATDADPGTGGSQTWIDDTPIFKEMPLKTTSTPYASKPAPATAGPFSGYWTVTSWTSQTYSGFTATPDTENFPVRVNLTGSDGVGSNDYPCSWIKINGVWKFGFYMAAYNYTETKAIPNDGYYSVISNLDDLISPLTASNDWNLQQWRDHSGVIEADIDTSPYNPYTTYTPWATTKDPGALTIVTKARSTVASKLNGRMLYVNCSQTVGVTGAVYKRLVTELCRDAMFEFSCWMASAHYKDNNSQFRIEIWSENPGENPSLGALTSANEGQSIPEAGNAVLMSCGAITNAILGQWMKLTNVFTLTGQDYCWVVVRNYGIGSGNDIVIDDLVFKPYAPFNLTIALTTGFQDLACDQGLVSLVSTFPTNMPSFIDISQYGFYFQGQSGTNAWVQLGSPIPIQTQTATEPLELTIPLAEYNLYDRYRVIVATVANNINSKCITFTYPPTDKEEIGNAPEFQITGLDVCGDGSGTQTGTFTVTNTNQVAGGNWQIKVRLPNGTITTLNPTP